MAKKLFLKIWTTVLTSLALAHADGKADVLNQINHKNTADTQLSLKESKMTDLFLQHAKDTYADQMLFAGHRSHSSHRSHRSHYSSRTYSPPSSQPMDTQPQEVSPPSHSISQEKDKSSDMQRTNSAKKYNIADMKMVQISLNLLGFDAGKVDGSESKNTKDAITNFQSAQGFEADGKLNSKTCLSLARKIKEQFPDDDNAKTIYNDLLKLYMKLAID